MKPNIIPALIGLLLLTSCATGKADDIDQIPPIKMNKNAGNGSLLFVTLDLKNTRGLTFLLDTGTPATCLDNIYQPELGRCARHNKIWFLGTNFTGSFYDSPALYLGDKVLMKSGPYILTCDLTYASEKVRHKLDGILGMDILENYCVQLDFKSKKVRFLDDSHLNRSKLGTPFPLTQFGFDLFYIKDNLVGIKGPGSMIDTGNDFDGWLTPDLLHSWTNKEETDGGAHFPDAILGGEIIHGVDGLSTPITTHNAMNKFNVNGIGLHLLSRYIVTLDFPNQTMYLKRIR